MLSLIDNYEKQDNKGQNNFRLDPKRVDLDPRGVDPETQHTQTHTKHEQRLEHDLGEVEIQAKSRASINIKGKS